jgi:hypothetical protein
MVDVQIMAGDAVWAQFRLVETLFPKGPLGQAAPLARRAFLVDRRYVPGMALSGHENGVTTLSLATVKASDWLAGTVASIYAPEYGGVALGAEPLALVVAVKEHVARQWQLHPAQLVVALADERAGHDTPDVKRMTAVVTSPMLPLNRVGVQARLHGETWQIGNLDNAPSPSLDLSAVQDFWRTRAHAGSTVVEDLTLALMQRFVRRVEITDPAGFASVQGRGVLYLANHQLDLESALFVSLIAALQGTVTTAIARQELGESWIGPYFDICFQHPQIVDPHMLLLIDRASPEAVFRSLEGALERTRSQQNSLLVHVEGAHALQARRPVEVISTALIDLAVAKDVPIVPLRFFGGLPVAPVAEPLAFPVDYGRQDFLVGAPLLPELLAPLSSAERRVRVLAALNGFDERWQHETPNPGDAAFAAEVAQWRQTKGVSEVQAVLYRTLCEAAAPSAETQWLLDKVQGKRHKGFVPAAEVKQWLAVVASQLLGVK